MGVPGGFGHFPGTPLPWQNPVFLFGLVAAVQMSWHCFCVKASLLDNGMRSVFGGYSSVKAFSRKLWVRSDKGMFSFFRIW